MDPPDVKDVSDGMMGSNAAIYPASRVLPLSPDGNPRALAPPHPVGLEGLGPGQVFRELIRSISPSSLPNDAFVGGKKLPLKQLCCHMVCLFCCQNDPNNTGYLVSQGNHSFVFSASYQNMLYPERNSICLFFALIEYGSGSMNKKLA